MSTTTISKAMQAHLDSLSINSMLNWKPEAFITYASSTTAQGFIELGLTGYGFWAIRINKTDIGSYDTAQDALNRRGEASRTPTPSPVPVVFDRMPEPYRERFMSQFDGGYSENEDRLDREMI